VTLLFMFREPKVAGQRYRQGRGWIRPWVGRDRAGLLARLRRAFCLYRCGVA